MTGSSSVGASQTAPNDLPAVIAAVRERVRPFTMTSDQGISALCNALLHLRDAGIHGDIVECGVWKGGSMMAAGLMLAYCGDLDRRLHLYDTFAGMSAPGPYDVSYRGLTAEEEWRASGGEGSIDRWCRACLDEVRGNMAATGIAADRLEFIVGPVEETLARQAPPAIALLRLDTDWYASTLAALRHLYPRLSPGGVLIIDDYGHWRGARRAVDEYFASQSEGLTLIEVDYTVRIGFKPGSDRHHAS